MPKEHLPGQSVEAGCPFFISQPVRPLSERERQALTLAAHGCPTGEIGRRLHIAERTAKAHLQAVREKLNAVNTTHAVFVAALLGLIKFDTSLAQRALPQSATMN